MNYEEMFKQLYYMDTGQLSPVKCSIIIQSSAINIWNMLLDTKSWIDWWGNLKSVKPQWKLGAIIKWEHGGESKITVFENHKEIAIAGPSIQITITLTSEGDRTEVSLEEKPINGAKWTDSGKSRFAPVNSALLRFKNLIET
jgi:hypothetical protein